MMEPELPASSGRQEAKRPHRARTLDIGISGMTIDPRVNPVNVPERFDFPNRPHLEERFDYTTLLYDVHWDHTGKTIHAQGPDMPPELRGHTAVRFRALPSRGACQSRVLPAEDCFSRRYRIRPPEGTTGLEVTIGAQTAHLAIQPNLSHLFAGRRVLMAIVHNNPLTWVVDWVGFHQRRHGADAVLLYDNLSTAYQVQDLREAVASVPGIATVVVAHWPYGYGINPPNVGFWLQEGTIGNAQRRFLTSARWVAALDIDELFVSISGESIDDLVASDPAAWFELEATCLALVRSRGEGPLRHRDLYQTSTVLSGPKMVVVPPRLPALAEWRLHNVNGAPGHKVDPSRLRMYHFLPLTTGAIGREVRQIREDGITPADAVEDLVLRDQLDAAFPDHEPAPTPRIWSELDGDSAGLAAKRAKKLLAAGDAAAALPFIEHAIGLMPADRHLADVRATILRAIG